MASSAVLSDQAIQVIAAAVFQGADPWVAEAYSDFDTLPLQFRAPEELALYASKRLAKPKGSAFFFVTYPDMSGRAVRQTIKLKPGSTPGNKLRYTWEGWGLISVLLERGDRPHGFSRISANSERRANKWRSTYTSWDPPETWNWKAVASHTRRLQRVLKTVA